MRRACLLLAALLLTSCDACSEGKDKPPVKLSCEDACEQSTMASFDFDACENFCWVNLPPDGRSTKERDGYCKDYCYAREVSTKQLTTMGCTFRCQQDPDGDMILGSEDLCPEIGRAHV